MRAEEALGVNLPQVAHYLEHLEIERAHFGWAPPVWEDAELAAAALAGVVAQDWVSDDDYNTLTESAREVGWLQDGPSPSSGGIETAVDSSAP